MAAVDEDSGNIQLLQITQFSIVQMSRMSIEYIFQNILFKTNFFFRSNHPFQAFQTHLYL